MLVRYHGGQRAEHLRARFVEPPAQQAERRHRDSGLRQQGRGLLWPKSMLPRLLAIVVLLVVTGCHASVPKYPYASEPDPRRGEYVIGVADSLQVRVWKNPELSTDIQVRPDGTITMPLLGDIRAAGLTPTQLKNEIRRRMSQYITDRAAIVTVAVTAVRSYEVVVSGRVGHPGVFGSNRYLTVLEAISLAGGPTPYAATDDLLLVRRNPPGTVRRIPIRYDLLVQGQHPEMNLILMRGDQLYMP